MERYPWLRPLNEELQTLAGIEKWGRQLGVLSIATVIVELLKTERARMTFLDRELPEDLDSRLRREGALTMEMARAAGRAILRVREGAVTEITTRARLIDGECLITVDVPYAERPHQRCLPEAEPASSARAAESPPAYATMRDRR